MFYRHQITKAVVEAPATSEYEKDPEWDRIDGPSTEEAPPVGVQDVPSTDPAGAVKKPRKRTAKKS